MAAAAVLGRASLRGRVALRDARVQRLLTPCGASPPRAHRSSLRRPRRPPTPPRRLRSTPRPKRPRTPSPRITTARTSCRCVLACVGVRLSALLRAVRCRCGLTPCRSGLSAATADDGTRQQSRRSRHRASPCARQHQPSRRRLHRAHPLPHSPPQRAVLGCALSARNAAVSSACRS